MILVMLPFFLFAMYERNGQPPGGVPWAPHSEQVYPPEGADLPTNNLYSALVRQHELEQEVRAIAGKNRKTRKNGKAQT